MEGGERLGGRGGGWRAREKFECLGRGGEENFHSKGLTGYGFSKQKLVLLIGMYSHYDTHVVSVKSVFSVPLFRHILYPMEKLSD